MLDGECALKTRCEQQQPITSKYMHVFGGCVSLQMCACERVCANAGVYMCGCVYVCIGVSTGVYEWTGVNMCTGEYAWTCVYVVTGVYVCTCELGQVCMCACVYR